MFFYISAASLAIFSLRRCIFSSRIWCSWGVLALLELTLDRTVCCGFVVSSTRLVENRLTIGSHGRGFVSFSFSNGYCLMFRRSLNLDGLSIVALFGSEMNWWCEERRCWVGLAASIDQRAGASRTFSVSESATDFRGDYGMLLCALAAD